MKKTLIAASLILSVAGVSLVSLHAQQGLPVEPGGPRPGGPGGRGGFGGPGGPMGGGDQKLVAQFDNDKNGRLDKDERAAAREFIKKERAAGRGGGRGPGGPGGFGGGPAMMVAPRMMADGDKDADQKLSKDEFTALAGAWFDKLDADKAGKLNRDQVAERIGEILPPPQGFGGPGGPGGRGDVVGPGGPGGPGGFGGGRGGFGPGRFLGSALFDAADANKDDSLTRDEWNATFGKWFGEWDKAKAGSLDENAVRDGLTAVLPRPQFGGPGGGPGGRGQREPAKPGPKVSPAEVKNFPDSSLYEPTVLRTLFFDFENADWEAELSDFRNTDVEVPATLTVDGRKLPNVGVAFRGASSLFGVPDGYKRSLNVSTNLGDKGQRLYGYKTLNLLNSNDDPTFLHTVLYFHAARQYMPAPKANLVKVVVNGESWGVYTNVQQFNKDFLKEWFPSAGGARWKVPGRPGGRGGLEYVGEDVAEYKRLYEIKSDDDPKAWADLINLCKILSETPADKLEAALAPILDVEGVLWFLALENAFINSDGYWVRASDYSIYQDKQGKFHIIPHDANETFQPGMGPGMGGRGGRGGRGGPDGRGGQEGRGGPGGPPGPGGPDGPVRIPLGPGGPGGFGGPGPGGGAGAELDPLVALDDPGKPLRSKLLAVPALKARYLQHVRTLADQWLDWQKLQPVVNQYRALIDKEVEADTRKLSSYDEFKASLDGAAQPAAAEAGPGPGAGRRRPSLQAFVTARRNYLLNHPEIKKLDAAVPAAQAAAPASPAAAAAAPAPAAGAVPQSPADLFRETKVWSVHLTFTPEQWEAMEPKDGPGPGGRPGGPPRGFGPGMFLGPAFLNLGDQNADKKLSKDEFRGMAEKWFGQWDKEKAGKVNAEQLRDGINVTLAPPPGAGPGGPGGPGRPGGPGGGRPPGMNLQGQEGRRNGLASAIGIEFSYVRADLDFSGQSFKDVAVRYKGNGTFLQSRASNKRSMKVDLNDHAKDQKLAGVTKLNLHNSVTDASWMNEVLSHRLFRDAGVPAPRAAYARVHVTVPGKYDNQYLGLYSLVENVDDNFAEKRFGSRKGGIFKPVTGDLFAYLGDDWAKYNQTYDPKTGTTPDDKKRVIEFAKLVTEASDADFEAKVGDYLDLDNFSRFMAVTAWLPTLDSILTVGQNYYVYLHPQTRKFHFIPWDLDHSFGQFFLIGSNEQRQNLDVDKPWQGDKRFLDRVFKTEAFKKLYRARLEEFSGTIFKPERLHAQVDEVAAAIRAAVKDESEAKLAKFDQAVAGKPVEPAGFGPPPGGGPGGPGGAGRPGGQGGPPGFVMPQMPPVLPIKAFVGLRHQSVLDQLAGKSEGEPIPEGFGPRPGGPGGRGPGGRGPGGPGGGGPGAFGPGMFLGPAFMNALDADKDGHLARDELTAGFGKWFDAWNTDKSGALTEEQLRDGINQEFNPFRGGGPQGAPPGPQGPPPGR